MTSPNPNLNPDEKCYPSARSKLLLISRFTQTGAKLLGFSP
jgi:hypothetical protein